MVVPEPSGPPVTVRGTVLNAATGQPLQRALVQIAGRQERGSLTDQQGRFTIHAVPSGVWPISITKPFYYDRLVSGGPGRDQAAHPVRVADGMPELVFQLVPKGAISGKITLSTGIPAQGIDIDLLRRTITNGRIVWTQIERHLTTPDGAFRFSGLGDNTYLLLTQVEFENDTPKDPGCNPEAPAQMRGFAAQYYGGSHGLEEASRIVVAGGQTAEANLQLTFTTLYRVDATLAGGPTGENSGTSARLTSKSGRQLQYPVTIDKGEALCAYVPDGSYHLTVTAPNRTENGSAADGLPPQGDRYGSLDFTVEGRGPRDLKLALLPSGTAQVFVRYEPGPRPKAKESPFPRDRNFGRLIEPRGERPPVVLYLVPADGDATEPMRYASVGQSTENTLSVRIPPPGAYFVDAYPEGVGMCTGTVSAGGENLAHTPWVVGTSNAPPIEIVVRTDCASLKLRMPPMLPAESPGEGATIFAYLIPAFDSVDGIREISLDQFGDREQTIPDLTPGPYRVLSFRSQQQIAFRESGVLDQLGPGQNIVLEPSSQTVLVPEGIAK